MKLKKFVFEGVELIEKIVTTYKGNSTSVTLPKSWHGKKVAIVRLE